MTRGRGVRHVAVGVLFSSAAAGAYSPIAMCCPSLGPSPSVGGGARRPLTAPCPPSPSSAYLSLSTPLSIPSVGCAHRAPGLSLLHCSVPGPHGRRRGGWECGGRVRRPARRSRGGTVVVLATLRTGRACAGHEGCGWGCVQGHVGGHHPLIDGGRSWGGGGTWGRGCWGLRAACPTAHAYRRGLPWDCGPNTSVRPGGGGGCLFGDPAAAPPPPLPYRPAFEWGAGDPKGLCAENGPIRFPRL